MFLYDGLLPLRWECPRSDEADLWEFSCAWSWSSVATTTLLNSDFTVLNGVHITQFAVTGNLMSGMTGGIERYYQFVRSFKYDAILIKAAQQWTFDAL